MAVVAATFVAPITVLLGSNSSAAGAPTVVAYEPGTPSLASITSPTGCTGTACAPWNESQGTPTVAPYTSKLLLTPTYTPGGSSTGSGATAEPNMAVYPGKTSKNTGVAPYPSGVVGTPGPLDGYCGEGTNATESKATRTNSRQAAGSTLPFAPAYFPHVVKSTVTGKPGLIGYFDYRPKDADEALVAATATATGKHWTYKGEALEQNRGYCPSTDINDDGEGHANIARVATKTLLYTLPRAAGDSQGVGMIVHKFNPTATHPLGSGATALPRTEKTGVDPDAFATTARMVTHTTTATLTVTSTGSTHSTEQLVAGGFVDLTVAVTSKAVFTCAGVTPTSLTGCKTNVAGTPVTVSPGNLIEQVIGFTNAAYTIPKGPNKTIGTGGLAKITVTTTVGGGTAGFTNRLTGTILNNNAPNRIYVNGVTVYCTQANTNPTTKVTGCTTGPDGTAYSAPAHSPILSDPIIPKSAYESTAGNGMTSGLVSPDGIVSVLPKYPGAPTTKTTVIVMYTEKELNYYVAGVMAKTSKPKFSSTTMTIPFTPGPYFPGDMPSVINATHKVTISMGDKTKKAIIPVTCSGMTTTSTATHPEKLTGCKAPVADNGDTGTKSTSWIGAPGATTVPYTTLKLTGEGKTTPEKLMKNNQDLTILRVAYTTTGVRFKTTGLANTGIISGKGTEGTTYNDINNPASTTNPTVGGTIDLNKYKTPGTPDATELRWVGSAGSVIANPNGTIGLFLSGSWAADGDSDAFNQIFFSESSTGEKWSVPKMVMSTDYTFSASGAQDTALAHGNDTPLGISAYYEGRAYGPSVVAHTGKLTMVFAGYRLPKTIEDATTTIGTGYGGAPKWKIGKQDPALYRNILAVNLAPTTTTTIAVSTSHPVVGQSVSLSSTVSEPTDGSTFPTGTVTFTGTHGGTKATLCSGTLSTTTGKQVASCNYAFDATGTNQVTAVFHGSTDGLASTSATAATVTVGKDSTSVNVTPSASPAKVGQTVTLTATVKATSPGAGTPTGTVTFQGDRRTVCTARLGQGSPGVATCAAKFTTAGTETVTASYAGDGDDVGSSGSYALTVAPDPTTTSVTLTPPDPVTGQKVTATVTVTANGPGSGYPTGTVAVGCRGCRGTATLLNGVLHSATHGTVALAGTITVGAGGVVVTAAYAGSTNYSGSTSTVTLTVGKDATATALSVIPTTAVVGQPVTLEATVTAAATGSGTPTGTVAFTQTGIALCATAPLSATTPDTATCKTTYTGTGTFNVKASYAGDGNFTGSSTTGAVVVDKDPTTTTVQSNVGSPVVGQPITLTATVEVTSPGAGTPTGKVTFSDAQGTLCRTVNLSAASPDTAVCRATFTGPSAQAVTATYGGDTSDLGSTGGLGLAIGQAATKVTLSVTTPTPVAGQPVTVKATVSAAVPGAGTPTGSVSFNLTGGLRCAAGSISGGLPSAQTCVVTDPVAGQFGVTARYSGDANFKTSTAAVAVTVGKAGTATSVSSSPAHPAVGGAITLKATVAAVAPGAGTPSGTVSFTDGSTVLCTADLSSGNPGTAACTTSYPGSVSGRTVTATYNGNASFDPSHGTTSLTVVYPPSLTSVTPSSGSVAGGTVVTIIGTHLTGATSVQFGSAPATSFKVVSATTVTAVSPPGKPGVVNVSATSPAATSPTVTGDRFTYDPVPTLSAVTPTAGKLAGGTTVTLSGSGFRTGATVTFGAGNHGATVHVSGTTSLTVKAPFHAVGTVTVTVTTPGGTSGTKPYTYDPVPTITSLSRTSGPVSGGTQVTVTGTGFSTVASVKFGTTTATSFTVRSATQLEATAPVHAAGTARISVTTPGGTTPATGADLYDFTVPAPEVSAISPANGPATGGTTVTVSGTGFTGTTTVFFGSAKGKTVSVNAGGTQLSVKSPAGTSGGSVAVRVVTPEGESAAVTADLFGYGPTGPTITSLSRTSGPVAGGTKVTITGTGFTTVTYVKFGTTTAGAFTVKSATQITATSPAHAAGQVRISVVTAAGTTPAIGNDLYAYP
jgi:hypothetical protein